jgi:hypothetical protein
VRYVVVPPTVFLTRRAGCAPSAWAVMRIGPTRTLAPPPSAQHAQRRVPMPARPTLKVARCGGLPLIRCGAGDATPTLRAARGHRLRAVFLHTCRCRRSRTHTGARLPRHRPVTRVTHHTCGRRARGGGNRKRTGPQRPSGWQWHYLGRGRQGFEPAPGVPTDRGARQWHTGARIHPRTPGGHTGRGVERRVRKTQGQRTLRRRSPTVRHRPITAATGLPTTRYLRTCAVRRPCPAEWQLPFR